MSSPLVLIGLPGSGKSSAAEALGRLTGRPVVVLDAAIEAAAGRPITEIFATEGEAWFRDLEHRLLVDALADADVIIDGGGGLVVRPENRAALAASAVTVWLDAPDAELADRLGAASDRPLLAAEGPDATLVKLRTLRRDRLVHYTSAADAIVPTGGRSPDQVAAAVLEAAASAPDRTAATRVEQVGLADGRSYPVIVGRKVLDRLPELLPDRASRVAVVTQPGVGVAVETGREQRVFEIENGEQAKRLEVVGDLASRFAAWGMTRADCVVSVGGGVVSDLAGFVAASYHRGIPVIHVSTTLLGQIDAAIGGKTGVNLPEGKNLVGAFWQPTAVICDVDTLASLPPREFRSGMGELAKYHFLGGGRLDEVELVERVARSVRIRPMWWPATNEKVAAERSSTTATRWPTPWRRRGSTACVTVRRSESG